MKKKILLFMGAVLLAGCAIPDDYGEPDKNGSNSSKNGSGSESIATIFPDAVRGWLMFNEIMYDCASNGAEYIEIYNPTDSTISVGALSLWKLYETGDAMSKTTLKLRTGEPIEFPAHGYLCFTKKSQTLINLHGADPATLIEIANFPALNNDGGCLALMTSEAKPRCIDNCRFANWMHTSGADTRARGIAIEKYDPSYPSLVDNWCSSADKSGGTPGRANIPLTDD